MKLVIFDLDGTLLNTLKDLMCAVNAALATCNFPPRTQEEIQQFVGNGVSKLLERSLAQGEKTPEHLTRLKSAFFTYYDAHLWDYTQPYPGIKKLLQGLASRHVQLAIASNKYQSAVERLAAHFFPQVPFAAVLGQREGIPTKPNPQIVFEILKIAGVSPADALYVGDSAVDMQTAQNAGVKACGVTWGFRPRATLAAYCPAWLVDAPKEILPYID